MTYLLFWLLSALICMSLAKTRGRSEAVGFLCGLIFGIFAIMYYLIAGDTVEQRVKKEEDARRKYQARRKNK